MHSGGDDRRRYARHPIPVPIRFRAPGSAEELRSQVGDLSEGGLSFPSPRPFPAGERLEVILPVESERFTLTAAVACCTEDPAAGRFRIGLRFEEPSVRFRLKLAEQILRIEELRRELSRSRGGEVPAEEAAREWVASYAREFAELYDAGESEP